MARLRLRRPRSPHLHRPPESPRLRSLASQSLIYGMGGIVSKLVGVFLLPIYVKPEYAGRAAFGTSELVMAAITALAIFLRLGITNSMSRFTVGDPDNHDWRPVVQTVFVSVLIASTVASLVGLLFLPQIAELLQCSHTVAATGIAGLWVTMNYDVIARVYRIERRARAFVVWTILNIVLTIILTFLLVVVWRFKAEGILLANFLGTYIVFFILVIARWEVLGFHFDRALYRRMLSFALPLMPAGLALWALNFADRFQVQRFAGKGDLGSYSIAAKLSLGIMLVLGAFQTAWPPFAHSIRGNDQARQVIREVFTYWNAVMCWALVALTLVSAPYVELALASDVHNALPVVPLLMGGAVLYGAFTVVNMGVNISMRTRMTPIITGASALLNIGLNFWMIPAWSILGAGISTLIGYAALLWLGWWNAQQSFPVSYDWWRFAKICAVTVGFCALSLTIVPAASLIGIVIRGLLIMAFPFGLAAVGAVTAADRKRARSLLAMRKGKQPDPGIDVEVAAP